MSSALRSRCTLHWHSHHAHLWLSDCKSLIELASSVYQVQLCISRLQRFCGDAAASVPQLAPWASHAACFSAASRRKQGAAHGLLAQAVSDHAAARIPAKQAALQTQSCHTNRIAVAARSGRHELQAAAAQQQSQHRTGATRYASGGACAKDDGRGHHPAGAPAAGIAAHCCT